MSPVGRLYERAARHAASLPPAEATGWIIRHGLLALAGRDEVPAAVRERLHPVRRRNLATNLHRIRQFQQLVDALEGIPVCPLKGIELLDTVYRDDPENRVMVDIDLLVPEASISRAVERLTDRLPLTEPEGSAARRHFWHDRCLAGPGLVVEVHARLGIKHGWATRWEDLGPRPGRLHDRAVHRLDAATTLIHLVSHFVKHGPFIRLGWAEDVLRAAADEIDVTAALARAEQLGARRTFLAGVRALARLVGEDILPQVSGRGGGAGGVLLAANERWLWRRALADPLGAEAASSKLRRNLTALLLADRPADALRFLGVKGRELWLRRKLPDSAKDG